METLESFMNQNYQKRGNDNYWDYPKSDTEDRDRENYWKLRVSLDNKSQKGQEAIVDLFKFLNSKNILHKSHKGETITVYSPTMDTTKEIADYLVPVLIENPDIIIPNGYGANSDTKLIDGLCTRYESGFRNVHDFAEEIDGVIKSNFTEDEILTFIDCINNSPGYSYGKAKSAHKSLESIVNPSDMIHRYKKINKELSDRIHDKYLILPDPDKKKYETPLLSFLVANSKFENIARAAYHMTYLPGHDETHDLIQNIMKKDSDYIKMQGFVNDAVYDYKKKNLVRSIFQRTNNKLSAPEPAVPEPIMPEPQPLVPEPLVPERYIPFTTIARPKKGWFGRWVDSMTMEDVYHNREKVAKAKKEMEGYDIVKKLYRFTELESKNPGLVAYHQDIRDTMDDLIKGVPGAIAYSNSLISELEQKIAKTQQNSGNSYSAKPKNTGQTAAATGYSQNAAHVSNTGYTQTNPITKYSPKMQNGMKYMQRTAQKLGKGIGAFLGRASAYA